MATDETQNSQRHYKYFVVRDIKKVKDSSGNEILSVPIQSLQADREGDVVNEQGQQDIIRQLQTGNVPAFPNHGMGDSFVMYDFREIMGKWVGGEVNGNTTYGYLQLRKNNSSAEALMDLIEQDMPVGFSIGFIPKEYEEKQEGMEFSAVDLLEVSPVGIPSNAVAVHGNNVDMINAVTQAIETDGSAEAVKAKIKQFIGGNMTEEKQSNEQPEQETKESDEEEKSDNDEDEEEKPDDDEDEEDENDEDEDEEDYKQFKSEVKEKLSTLESKIQQIEESLKDKSKSVETKSEESETEEAEDTENTNDIEEQNKEEYENGNEEPKDTEDTAETTEEETTEDTGETEEAGKSAEPDKGKGKKIKTIDETNTQEEQSIQPEEPNVRGFTVRY